MLRQVFSERLVYDCRVVKDLRDVGLQQDHIGTPHVPLVVLAAHAPTEIHLRDVIFIWLISCVAHRIYVLSAVLRAR